MTIVYSFARKRYVFLGTFTAKEANLVFPCAYGFPCTAVVSGILQDPANPPRLFPYTHTSFIH